MLNLITGFSHAAARVAPLPAPAETKTAPLHLTLHEAILLALRQNPAVISAGYTRLMDKFGLLVAHQAYLPQFTLGGQTNWVPGSGPVNTVNAGANLNTIYGTQFGVNYNNTLSSGNGPVVTSFSITEPLLQGFGRRVNEIPWLNALDNEKISRLSYKGLVMERIVTVINAYYTLVQDQQNLAIQSRAVEHAKKTVADSALRYRVGQLAKTEWLQQEANYETTRLSWLRQKSSMLSDYQALLAELGLPAKATLAIDTQITLKPKKIPDLNTAINLALNNNITYQQQRIALRAMERAVISAKDAARWQLNLTANYAISGTNNWLQFINANNNQNAQVYNAQNSPSIIAALSIPINNMPQKQAMMRARWQEEQAKLQLATSRENLIRQVTNQIQQLENMQLTLKSSERQVRFARENMEAAQIKYRYGRISAFELNQLQEQLIQQETNLVATRLSYLNQEATLNQLLGTSLQVWHIQLRL